MSVKLHRLHQAQKGDTIVEVIIAIAVSSLILAGAYVTTNHSYIASRDAQERSAGIKLVEGQIEKLRFTAANNSALFTTNGTFCITGTSTITASSNSACTLDQTGATAASGTEPAYGMSIARVNNTFTVTSSWDSLLKSASGKDTITMVYRAYQ